MSVTDSGDFLDLLLHSSSSHAASDGYARATEAMPQVESGPDSSGHVELSVSPARPEIDRGTSQPAATPETSSDGLDPASVRLQTVAFECLANGLQDARVISLMHVLGWEDDFACFAVAGTAATTLISARDSIASRVRDLGGRRCLIGSDQGRCVALIAAQGAATPEVTCTAILPVFDGAQPVCLSPVYVGVAGAIRGIHSVLTSLEAAPALQSLPRPMHIDDVLPERALLGDEDARGELYTTVYLSLKGETDDDPAMPTVYAFLSSGGALDATARELNVHPNTVRYRLKRAAETTGWDATNPREAYVLQTAIALGRIRDAGQDL